MDKILEAERCLQAVLLLIQTKAGIRHVCQWPPSTGDSATLLGYRIDILEKLLGAEAWNDDKRIEVTLGDITFVSLANFLETSSPPVSPADATTRSAAIPIEADFAPSSYVDRFADPEPGTSVDSGASGVEPPSQLEMSMFQLVIALNTGIARPTALEILEHILIPLSKSMKQLQSQSKWLDRERRSISLNAIKRQNIRLEEVAQPTDELTWAFKEIYDSINAGKIASFRLAGIHMALQIPRNETSRTATSELPVNILAVLLLEDKSKLLHELDRDPGSAALAYFITHVVPTKSLSKLSTKLNLHIDAIVLLAKHLVKWRRARLITPLHARNTYVPDPDLSIRDLAQLEREYSRRFPALLSLDSILGMIGSATPVVFASILPSRAHRDTYMDILAWLTRHELVVRMQTMAWLCVGETDTPTTAQLILDPGDLTPKQKRFVRSLLASVRDTELVVTLAKMLPYFNGEYPLEDIASLEGLKRAKVEECLQALREQHALRTVQCL